MRRSAISLAWLLVLGCLPSAGIAQAAPVSNVPASVAAKIGMPQDALIGYKKEMGDGQTNGPVVHLTFYDAKVTREQVNDAPARLCKWLGKGLATYEFKPRAQKPDAPLERRMRIQCSRN